jgi:hypothetical protein
VPPCTAAAAPAPAAARLCYIHHPATTMPAQHYITHASWLSAASGCAPAVNIAGTYFAYGVDGSPKSVECPTDSYGPGLRKQRACVPCPPGYTTAGVTGSVSISACGESREQRPTTLYPAIQTSNACRKFPAGTSVQDLPQVNRHLEAHAACRVVGVCCVHTGV